MDQTNKLENQDGLKFPARDAKQEIPLIPESITVRWAGKVNLSDTKIEVVPSSLTLDQAEREVARAKFAETMEPNQTDAVRYRYEGVSEISNQLRVLASTGITYGEHNVLRFSDAKEESKIINPLTMYSLFQDREGYFIGGLWDQDQRGQIASAPVGFIDVAKGELAEKDFVDEIRLKFIRDFKLGDNQSNELEKILDNTQVRAVISGENKDTTIVMFARTELSAQDISLTNPKYSAVVRIPPQADVLQDIIETGQYQGNKVNDLFRAALAIYLKDLNQQA